MSVADFGNFVVVVTGASTGLGRALAVETARRGASDIVINYARSADEAEVTADQVRAEGARAILVQGDVSRDEDCRRIAAAAAPLGRIDALFNNAGVTKFAQNHADLDAVSAEDFLHLYGVNVVGAFQMVRAARSLLEAAPQPGAVVNTSSIAGVAGIGSSVPYAASKGAMNTLTISLARALAPKIRVNGIAVGSIATSALETVLTDDGLRTEMVSGTPLKRLGEPEDIAIGAVYLASPASSFVTGKLFEIDGGLEEANLALGLPDL